MRTEILSGLFCAAALALGFCGLAQAQDYGNRGFQPYESYREQPYRSARPVLAVEEFRAGEGRGSAAAAENLRGLLVRALKRDRRFAVAPDDPDREDSGADVLIEGTVTDYRIRPAGRGMESAGVDISLELLDAATGESIGRVSATGSGSAPEAGLSPAMDAGSFSATALGRAGDVAIRLAVPKIAALIRRPD